MSLETLARRDRLVTALGLVGLGGLAWLHVAHMALGMDRGAGVGVPLSAAWSPREVALTFVMWVVMMAAMMVPAAGPMILAFATINRRQAPGAGPPVPTGIFLVGYLAVWAGFSLVATLGQWALTWAALLSPVTLSVTPVVGSLLLLAAGGYQFTPLKARCLARCQSPIGFILSEWREGPRGALVMGLRHGAFCVGCCWVLMALLFAAGVMNLFWIAAIAALVLLEKLSPAPRAMSWGAGALLLAWGGWLLLHAL